MGLQGKTTHWEGGVHGAAFIWSPLLKVKLVVSNQLMAVQDWLPTLMGALGDDFELPKDMDGVNLWKELSHNSPSESRRSVLHNNIGFGSRFALRVGDYKLLRRNSMKNCIQSS